MNTQTLDLSLNKQVGNQQITIAQGDVAGTTIVATIYDNGTRLASSGIAAYFVMELPDGTHYVRDTTSYNNGIITYVCDEDHIASVSGTTDNAYFELYSDGSVIASTERFAVHILESAYNGHEPAEDWDNAIQQIVADGNSAISTITAANKAMTDAENARVENEKTRNANELSRGINESKRASAETARATAEKTRAEDFSTMVGEFNGAKRAAAAATDDALDAAAAANAAAGRADTATQTATAAADRAEELSKYRIGYDTVGDTDYVTFFDEEE